MKRIIEIELGKATCRNCGYELFLNPLMDPNKFVQEFICSKCDKKFFKQEEKENVEQTIE